MLLLLAVDTSTSVASVALHDGERVVSETTWLAGREHSTRVLVEIQAALERTGHHTLDLTGLVVARGPGSFTGVRVALSVSKGIAAARGLPLWGVSSLDVVAAAAGSVEGPVRAVVEAGRGRMATALYQRGTCIDAPRLMTSEALIAATHDGTLVIGDLPRETRATLAALAGVQVASAAASLRRAGHLGELGWRAARSGDPGHAASVDALYLT